MAMAKRRGRKARQAVGFLFDENVPVDVSRYFGATGYFIAHIGVAPSFPEAAEKGRTLGYSKAPVKGTADAGLRYAVQDWILVTMDQNLLKPGRFPSTHRGVFVLDTKGSSAVEAGASLCNTFHEHYRDDTWCQDRRFVWARDFVEERALDNSVIQRTENK
jgi:hypothetical protein